MNKLFGGALGIAVVLAGCGGHSGHGSSASTGTSNPRQANTTTVATRRPAHTNAATHATGSASTSVATVPGSGPGYPGSTNASGGAAGQPNTPRATPPASGGPGKPTTTSSSPPRAADVAKAKAALRGCRANDPGITLAQLEREAASPEGIQC